MKLINLLLLFSLLISTYTAKAQQLGGWQQVDAWEKKSELVVLTDSILRIVLDESQRKHIPESIMNKNLIYFKMLFNPKFNTDERIRVATYIIRLFSESEHLFALDAVLETKKNLLAKRYKE